jgi:hypothetical protein
MKYLTIFLILLIANVNAETEAYHQNKWCNARNGQTEVRVKGGRVDCMLSDYSIEFGFANKWKEDIAQSRWYSLQTGKKAGIVMIYKKPTDSVYLGYVREYLNQYCSQYTIKHFECIKIWTVKDYE